MFKSILNRVKKSFSNYNELKKLKKYINNDNKYSFTEKDFNLYKNEIATKLSPLKTTSFSKSLNEVLIRDEKIFWPEAVSTADLAWLHHEIFDPFENNPSSYDHPKIEIDNAKWVIDAGCCEGYFSLFAFNRNPSCNLIAFEPLLEMEEALGKTFKNRIEEKRFVLEQKCIGKEKGFLRFQFDNMHLCDSASSSNLSNDDNKNDTSYEVEVTSLDEVGRHHGLKYGGVIKMDIEGAEMDALTGATEIMAKYKPKLAVAVYHDYENALKCKEIILKANPEYNVEFRGMYGYFLPPRPYILFAW